MLNNKYACGPCAKFEKVLDGFDRNILSRSHRSDFGLKKIQHLMSLIRQCLSVPEDYELAIVTGGGTGAIEMLLWSLCGARAIDVLQYGVFSKYWANDLINELKIPDVRVLKSDFWTLQHKEKVDFSKDLVLCWTETTTGISARSYDWIPHDREGLVISDMTATVYCENIDWSKVDAASFSWQKGLGGEAGLGCIILSPRAIHRLKTYIPERPIPRLYRIAKNGEINWDIFQGKMINTPSMFGIEEYKTCLEYVLDKGGLNFLLDRINQNYDAIKSILSTQSKFDFIIKDETARAKNVICLDVLDKNYKSLNESEQWGFLRHILSEFYEKEVAFDILGHIWTKPNIRIWNGPTIEKEDICNVITKLVNVKI